MANDIDQRDFIFYESNNKKIKVIVSNETVWLNQKELAELFNVGRTVITKHIQNIYADKELQQSSTSAKIAQVQQEGKREVTREIEYYNLDMIISVGYRVNSQRATQFRQWATTTLKEFVIKGFVLDNERLKQGTNLFNQDYFKELLEKVRSIRASERRIWQKITDIFAECSIDYDSNSLTTRKFYAMVQNKFHYAITGHTAAEIIYNFTDSKKKSMGLTTWKNSPNGRILKSDTEVAKNYLNEKDIKSLERIVGAYFDYIEGQIERRNTFSMEQFISSVNKFLEFNDYKILKGTGKISSKRAKNKAHEEYDTFNKTQKIVSDFDKLVKLSKSNPKKD